VSGPPKAVVLPVVLAVVLSLAGCSSPASAPSSSSAGPSSTAPSSARPPGPASPSRGIPTPDHVVVVVFENENAEAVVGSADAPYLTSLATGGASFTDAHGETHPSQPNYLALFSGSTHGVTDDRCPVDLTGPNLAGQLAQAGKTFVGYSEGLPEVGFTGCAVGDYARKHNPWVDFTDLPTSVNQPLTALPEDYARLPTVSFVVPDVCNDMHDCGVAAGDAWAHDHLTRYVDWAKAHNSLLVVTFDEDRGTRANHIATFLVGPMVTAGPSDQRIDHYGLLRTLEDMYGLPTLGKAASAEPITGVWSS
jgi:phosphatidylinositol-3-phosphatase